MIALIVDDDVFVRKCLIQMLPWVEMDFSQVLEADNGADALKLALEKKPDLIISDVKMPMLTGLELARELRDAMVDICIIMLSEYSDFELVQQALTCGVQDYILKPITRDKLGDICDKIRKMMSDMEKKRFYTLLKTSAEVIGQPIHDMLDTADSQMCVETFEYMALNQIHKEDLKHFGMNFLLELFSQTEAEAYQKEAVTALRDKAIQDYATLKNVADMLNFVRAQCESCVSLCVRKPPQTINYVAQINDYIDQHYDDPNLSVALISDWLHLSPVYTGALYKQHEGRSIITRINEVRMRHAKRLLMDTTINVASVSRKVGYMTPDYFSRLFSSSVGMSPSQYRFSKMFGESSDEGETQGS